MLSVYLSLFQRKNELSCSVLQSGTGAGDMSDAGSLRNFDAKSLRDIFSYRDDTLCETQQVLFKKKSEDDKQELQRRLGEFQTNLENAKVQ